ncbi:MAG: NHL repeat-containing protein [Acidimicrobiales bacterium]
MFARAIAVTATAAVMTVAAACATSGPVGPAPRAGERAGRSPGPAGGQAATGVVTVAGTGTAGSGGNGGPADRAQLDAPQGIAVDGSGDLFIADTGNCRVQMVPARSGTRFGRTLVAHHVVTVAGTRCGTPPGDGGIGYPTSVAVDRTGDLFIAEGTGNRVVELRANGSPTGSGGHPRPPHPVTVAGTGTAGSGGLGGPADRAQLDDPQGIAVDGAGDLFIADTENCRVVVVPARTGTLFGVTVTAGRIATVAGTGTCGTAGLGGPAPAAELWTPTAVAVDPAGDLLVADRGAGYVVECPVATGTYYGVPIGAGDLTVVAGMGLYGAYVTGGFPATGTVAELNDVRGLAVAPDGTLFAADTGERVIREVPAADGTVFGRSVTAADLYTAAGAAPTGFGGDSTRWVVTTMLSPWGLAVDGSGDLYYSDRSANDVREVLAKR